ncbi:MAG TPA: hypothetical protein VFS66_10340 [Acidimicrobiia bacterium]|nr:hypothetical protein [Acidimicrobiia bacterium]
MTRVMSMRPFQPRTNGLEPSEHVSMAAKEPDHQEAKEEHDKAQGDHDSPNRGHGWPAKHGAV